MPNIFPMHGFPQDAGQGSHLNVFILRKFMDSVGGISDQEANSLYSAWKSTDPGSSKLKAGLSESHVSSLRAKGYVTVQPDGVELTDKGRKIIIEMVTNAPNSFSKDAKDPSYTEIKRKQASRRPRETFVQKGKVAAFNLSKMRKSNDSSR